MARAYSLWLNKNLFDQWMLTIFFGSIGQHGTTKNYTYDCYEHVCHKLKSTLRRRSSAPQRLGCTYRLFQSYFDDQLKDLNLETIEQWLKPTKEIVTPQNTSWSHPLSIFSTMQPVG